MYAPESVGGLPRQIWFVALMALLLIGLLASLLLGWNPTPRKATRAESLLTTITPVIIPSPTISTALPAGVPADIARTSPAPVPPLPSNEPSLAPFPSRPRTMVDHYLLQRPIAPPGEYRPDRYYPYASRGDGSYPVHLGVEFVNRIGTPVLAAADGIIRVAGEDTLQVYGARDGFYGLVIIQELEEKWGDEAVFVVYGHLSRLDVQPGQRVRKGEIIGAVGMAGIAEGPHLHLEVRVGANDYRNTVNPDLWLQPLPGHGTLAGELLSANGDPVGDARLVLYRVGDSVPFRYFTSYPLLKANPDPAWGENFAT
ncbi:MAG: M23 family metallopeptidase, partial [Chloroflexi bacterium]|nr:M23 family metallopeptidase [Chloroflexota bacterium]